jgi:hypothetical protein
MPQNCGDHVAAQLPLIPSPAEHQATPRLAEPEVLDDEGDAVKGVERPVSGQSRQWRDRAGCGGQHAPAEVMMNVPVVNPAGLVVLYALNVTMPVLPWKLQAPQVS